MADRRLACHSSRISQPVSLVTHVPTSLLPGVLVSAALCPSCGSLTDHKVEEVYSD